LLRSLKLVCMEFSFLLNLEETTLGTCIILFLLLFLSIWLFAGLAVVCDEYLCPSLEKISEEFELPSSVSAATLLAFGSSAPELVLSFTGALSNNTETTIPTLLASALIAFGAIPAVAIILVDRPTIQLDPFTLFRDALAFFCALFILAYYSTRETTNLLQALILAGTYPIYVILVYFTHQDISLGDDVDTEATRENTSIIAPFSNYDSTLWKTQENTSKKRERSISQNEEEKEAPHIENYDAFTKADAPLLLVDQSSKINDSKDKQTCCSKFLAILQIPFRSLCEIIVCGGPKQSFFSMLLILGLLSYVAIILANLIVRYSHISRATAGMTILALGAQIPDTISAYELAKNGQSDAAISQAVGSQVINLTIGLGFPFALACLYEGHGVKTSNNGTILNLSILLACMIFIYIAIFFFHLHRQASLFKSIVSRSHGWFFATAFFLIYALSILTAEFSWPPHKIN